MFSFASPLYFLLLLPLAAAALWVYRPRVRHGLLFSRAQACQGFRPTWRQRAVRLLPAMLLLGLGCCIVALARPRTVLSRTVRTADVIAIQMVVDVSGSMEALDLSDFAGNRIVRARTRLDVVKEVFADFIRKRPDDLIGLVTFGGFAVTRSPLTSDHAALLHVLEGVEIPKASGTVDGQMLHREELMTAIGDALTTACARLRDAEPQTKIIVLLSDGESNAGIIPPEASIRVAQHLGIKVYTVAVGTSGRAPFMGRDMFGRPEIAYADIIMDEALLQRIAAETGARYFQVQDPQGLSMAMADIDRLEKTRVQRDVYEQHHEWFVHVLTPGLMLMALGASLNLANARRLW